MAATSQEPLTWHRVLDADELPEGRVTHRHGRAPQRSRSPTTTGSYGALDNRCPHQGGPLGEGTIENGLLRCPWHGYDYCPLTGTAPRVRATASRTFPVEVRDDGIFVGVPPEHAARAHGHRPDGRDDGRLGRDATSSGWSATPTSGSPTRCAAGRRRASCTYIGIRHEGAAAFAASAYGKLTGRPAACLTIAGPGATNLLTGLWDAQGRPRAGARADRPGRHPGARPRRVPGGRPARRVRRRSPPGARPSCPRRRHAELMTLAPASTRSSSRDVAHLIFPDERADAAGARRRRPRGPEGRVRRRSAIAPPGARARRAPLEAAARRPAPGDHRRPRRPLRHGRGHARWPSGSNAPVHHHVQGQGPDRRRPPARRPACSGAAARRSRAGS